MNSLLIVIVLCVSDKFHICKKNMSMQSISNLYKIGTNHGKISL